MHFNVIEIRTDGLTGIEDIRIHQREDLRCRLNTKRRSLQIAEEQLSWHLETEGDSDSQFSMIPELRKKIAALRTDVRELETIL